MSRIVLASLLAALSACGSTSTEPVATTDGSTQSDSAVGDDAGDDTAGDDTATPGEDVATSDTTSPGDTATTDTFVDPFGPFPAGPYGNTVGAVMANLAWEGHVTDLAETIATTKPYVTTSMDALRRKAPKGYAMVHVSEFF